MKITNLLTILMADGGAENIPLAILGYVATVITCVCFIPPVIKVFQTHRTSSLSLLMWLFEIFGTTAWSIYFLMLGGTFNWEEVEKWVPSLIVNLFVFCASTPILIFKIYNMIEAKKLGLSEFEYEHLKHPQHEKKTN